MLKKLGALALACIVLSPTAAFGQAATCRIVTACSNGSYTVGSPAACTMDVLGNLCTATSAALTSATIAHYVATPPTLTDGQTTVLRTDVKGRLFITEEKRATYSAAVSQLAIASGATDYFCVSGSASHTIILKRIRYSGIGSSTTQIPLILVKRSSADTGGTSSTLTDVAHDTTNAAATAVVKAYTENPTLGALVGNIRAISYTVVASNSNNLSIDIRELTFGLEEDQGIVLRGTAEQTCLNFNETAVSGVKMDISAEWREIVE
jgi:hypothetical protein